MPVLNIEGKRVTVDDSFMSLSPEEQAATVDEIAQSMGIAGGGQQDSSLVDDAKSARDKMYGDGVMGKIGKSLGAASDMVGSGLMFGFDDEISAGLSTGLGFLGDYSEAQKRFDARKKATREQNPVASTVGEIGGGLATGGALTKQGLTLAGRSLPVVGKTGAAALEGAAYGGLYGAGEAGQGERLQGAATGAATGGLTAGVMSKAGDSVANYVTRRATQKAVNAAPTAKALEDVEGRLFNAARASGVQVKPNYASSLITDMQMAAGRINDKLRPQTAGLVEDIISNPAQYTDIQGLHELRQQVGKLMGGASADDVRTLGAMKRVLDRFIDSPNPAAFTGSAQGFKLLRDGIQTSAKRFKAEEIEKLLDLADVVAEGNVTQSGIAAALRTKAGQLYKRIADGKVKNFSPEEVAMIRELASRNTSSKAIKWLAKWSPSGPMSTTLAAIVGGGGGAAVGGTVAGAAVGGPVGAMIGAGAVMAPGAIARSVADKGAIAAANKLRASSALGGLNVPQSPNRLSKYATPAAIAATQLVQQRLQSNPQSVPR